MTGKAYLACVLCALALGPSLTGQVSVEAPVFVTGSGGDGEVVAPPARNRSVPIGTSAIAGVVTEARTSLPVSGARVGVSGPADPVASRRTGVGLTSELQPARQVSRTVTTDERGRFVFDALPAGEFMVNVSRAGYLPLSYGAAKPDRPGTPIRIETGQRVDVSVRLVRGGVVAGVVTGPTGQPEFQAQVRALRLTSTMGVRRLVLTRVVSTDDRGAYRFFDLRPGQYAIAVSPRTTELTTEARIAAENARFEEALARARRGSGGLPPALLVAPVPAGRGADPPGYAPIYYPGTATPSAAVFVTVEPDTERLGLDFTAEPVRAGHVTGAIIGMPPTSMSETFSQADGYIVTENTRVQLSAFPDDDARDLGQVASATADPKGQFVIRNLAPGRYIVFAQMITNVVQRVLNPEVRGAGVPPPASPPRPTPPALWGRATVTVERESAPELTITLQPARTISGRIVHPGLTAGVEAPAVQVSAVVAVDAPTGNAGRVPQARSDPDGTFTITDVVPGRYRLQVSSPARSALVNGIDALDFPFDVDGDRDIANVVITLAAELAELSGSVVQSSGAPAPEYTVVIAPGDRRYWVPGARRVQLARPTSAGRFVFRGLPAGDYLVAAVTDLEPGRQYDLDFLAAMTASAVRVSIADGSRHVQDIRVAAPRP